MNISHHKRWLVWALLLGVAALLLWLVPWGRGGPETGGTSTRPDQGGAGKAELFGTTGGPTRNTAAEEATDDSEDEDEDGEEPYTGPVAAQAWLEVRVTCSGVDLGSAWSHVYVLDAGGEGKASWFDCPHAAVMVNEESERIPLLRAGVYDVGCTHDWGQTMLRDVVVKADATTRVTIEIEPPGVVRVRLLGTWPTGIDDPERAWVRLVPHGETRGRSAPGRGDQSGPKCNCLLHTELQGVRVRAGVVYRSDAMVVTPRDESATHVTTFETGSIVKPSEVRDGQELQVRFPAVRPVRVRIQLEEEWPAKETTDIELRLEGEGWSVRYYLYQNRLPQDHRRRLAEPVVLSVPPGPFRLLWDGRQVAAGESTRPQTGDGTPIDVSLKFDRERLAGAEPIPVRVEATGSWFAGHVHLWGPAELPRVRTRHPVWRTEPTPPLPASVRREFTHALGVARPDRLTEAVRLTPSGALLLRFTQGGFLDVRYPSEAYPTGLGPLELHRVDGAPLVSGEDISRGVLLDGADRIGPLLPGRHALRLVLAGKLVREFEVKIKAGAETLLDLTPR